MTSEKQKRPPYTGASDIETFFARIKTMQAPKKIDTAWVKTYKMAPNQPEGMPSLLKWLGIIDNDGAADPAIWDGVRLPQTRAVTLLPLMQSAYSEVFNRIDVENASPDDLASTFVIAYGMGDPGRQVRCFLMLCELAGLSSEPDLAGEGDGAAATLSRPHRSSKEKTTKSEPDTGDAETGNGRATSQPTSSVLLSLAVEIPAGWNEEQIRQRVATVARVLSEAGVGVV